MDKKTQRETVGPTAVWLDVNHGQPDPYARTFQGVRLDPYRILEVYEITHPAQQHAIKKLLRAGESHKSLRVDVEETIATLNRWLEMMEEDNG